MYLGHAKFGSHTTNTKNFRTLKLWLISIKKFKSKKRENRWQEITVGANFVIRDIEKVQNDALDQRVLNIFARARDAEPPKGGSVLQVFTQSLSNFE